MKRCPCCRDEVPESAWDEFDGICSECAEVIRSLP